VIVLVGGDVGVGVSDARGEIGLSIVVELAAVGLTVIVGGILVVVATGVSPVDWSSSIPPPPTTLQPATNTKKTNGRRIKCFLAAIPINPWGVKEDNLNTDIDCTRYSTRLT
ncbi:MAG: hypothetical protein PVG14_16815, partial [Anaerolineales bacterium]|jgi:hypothetical protein